MSLNSDAFLVTHAAAIHVAHAVFAEGLDDQLIRIERIGVGLFVVSHDAAFHHDLGVAKVVSIEHGRIVIGVDGEAAQARASQGQTTAAIDVAEDLAARHLDGVVAARAACGVVLPAEVAATAEDVAVVAGLAVGAQKAAFVFHEVVAQDVSVFRAAKHRAPDAVVHGVGFGDVHRDMSIVHVGELVVSSGIVFVGRVVADGIVADALSAAEHVAVGAVQSDRDCVARLHFWCRSHLSAGDVHLGQACVVHRSEVDNSRFRDIGVGMDFGMLPHAGQFAAAIHIVEHMAAADVDFGVAFHACCVEVAGIACAAAKHLAARGVDDAVVGLRVVGGVFPSITNRAHCAAIDVDFGVVLHLAQLAAAVHVAWHAGTFVKVDFRKHGGGESIEAKQRVIGVNDTTGCAKHAAAVPAIC